MVPAGRWFVGATRTNGVRALAALFVVVAVVAGSAAVLTFQQALDLRSAERAHLRVYPRVGELVDAVQRERHHSMQVLTAAPAVRRPALRTVRSATDHAWAVLRSTVVRRDVGGATDRAWTSRLDDLQMRMSELNRERRFVNAGAADRTNVFAAYSRTADTALAVLRGSPGARLAPNRDRYRSLIALRRLRELHGRRVSLVAAAVTSGVLTAAEHRALPRLDSAVRPLLVVAGEGLRGAERARFDQVVQSRSLAELARLEAGMIRPEGLRASPSARRLSARSWVELGAAVDGELRHVEDTVADRIVARSGSRADALTHRAWLATGVAVLLVLLAVPGGWILGSRRAGGSRRGPLAPPGGVPPALEFARRVEAVAHRQLAVLDELESATDDSDQLHRLFELDHLAVTTRRAAEVVAVLGGDQPLRRFATPVPLVDVVRSAAGEIGDYGRVTVVPFDDRVRLVPHPAVDLTHLLAELLETVTSRTSPDTAVRVTVRPVVEGEPDGVDVTVGVPDGHGDIPDLTPLHAAVDQPDGGTVPFVPAGAVMPVVVRVLAQRHGFHIRFPDPVERGTVLAVRIPAYLLADPVNGADHADHAAHADHADHADRAGDVDHLGDVDAARRDRQSRPEPSREPGGGTPLPKRVRQANLAPALRDDPVPSRPDGAADQSEPREDTPEPSAPTGRAADPAARPSDGPSDDSPLERIRSRYTSLQEGLARGRAAAPADGASPGTPADTSPDDPSTDERPPSPPSAP